MSGKSGHAAIAARVFRVLLALYPSSFRDEYGREMTLVFQDRRRDAMRAADHWRLWLDVLTGIVIEASREHARLLGQDVRYAFGRLAASPAYAATSIATLALAIGASTTMVSVLSAVVLRPLPYPSPDRLVMVWTEIPSQGLHEGRSAYWNVEQWRRQSRSFTDLAVSDPVSLKLASGSDVEHVSGVRASPNLFRLLGITALRGRLFSERDAQERQRLAVISYRFWQARFGGAPDVVGRVLVLDGHPSVIVGVLPKDAGVGGDLLEPHTLFADWDTRRAATGAGSWFVTGRLRPGVTMEQARTELDAIARRLDSQAAGAHDRTISVTSLDLHVVGATPRLAIWILSCAAALLLAVAVANVSGLSLARSLGRLPELAIRATFGASRARIVRLLLAEGMVVAAISGAIGLLVARAGIDAIKRVGPDNLARLQDARVDIGTGLWVLAISAASAIAVGLAPILIVWRADASRLIASAGQRTTAGAAATTTRRLFVAVQCAAAVVLLAIAGLLVRSWWNVAGVDPGFRPERVLQMGIAAPPSATGPEQAAFHERVLQELSSIPGVDRVGISSELFVGNVSEQLVAAEGEGEPRPMQLRSDEIAGAFFETLDTALVRGRFFTRADRAGASPVVIVNRALAERLWPGRDAVGRRLSVGTGEPSSWFTVVGVVGNMRRQGLELEPVPQMFQPLAQNPSRGAIVFVRAAGDPLPLAASLRAAVRRIDARAFASHGAMVDERLDAQGAQRRLQTLLLIGFSAAALLLALIGLYGLMQHSVAARTHEIGVRMALGARPADVVGMVLREGLALSVAGLMLGLVIALWAGQSASTLLFGVTATDPVTFVAVPVLLLAVALAACYLPARRATAVAPIVALRQREQ